jgi:hypothetical protein
MISTVRDRINREALEKKRLEYPLELLTGTFQVEGLSPAKFDREIGVGDFCCIPTTDGQYWLFDTAITQARFKKWRSE